jgi:hypothetical protein
VFHISSTSGQTNGHDDIRYLAVCRFHEVA